MSELKPCPFCGGKAKRHTFMKTTYFACTDCGAEPPIARGDSEDDAIKAWNDRPTEQTLRERGDKLAEVLKFYADDYTYDANGVANKRALAAGATATCDIYLVDPIENDKGKKAKQALSEWKKNNKTKEQ